MSNGSRRHFPRAAAQVVLAGTCVLFLSACGHVPLATMVKLSDFDFLKTAPETLRIAVKYPDSIRIPEGAAQMRLTLQEKSSGKMLIKEELAFERVETPAEKVELSAELQTGWRLEIYRLPESRINTFKAFQSRLVAMDKAERDKVNGSMDISVDACLAAAKKPEKIVVSTYLKAPELGGYVPLLKNADLQTLMAAEGLEGDAVPLGPCPDNRSPTR
ncbi:hypothetical protein [Roseibium sediminicola]|uniref:Lipoprotein n=1 Tax=Roseibium sediminicola TaxID=2933272 RepID=A0ABT0GV96_9HYPH|nr:hypothetical protein [Roseibium sp. CAU 1639]MCK7613354.1 hypothetical protein [Roseibium sp. CAU 1639]